MTDIHATARAATPEGTPKGQPKARSPVACMNRRTFLVLGGSAVTVLATFGEGAFAQELVRCAYPRKVIGKVSELEPGVAVVFSRTGVLKDHALAMRAKREGKKGHEKLREFGSTGIQTPIRVIDGKHVGTATLHDPNNDSGELEDVTLDQNWLYAFGTPTGKANMLKTPWTNDSWSDFYEAIKPPPTV